MENLAIRDTKWTLRRPPEGRSRLVTRPEDPGVVRIEIDPCDGTVDYDVQLNRSHFSVESGHAYALRFRARSDRPRTVSLGFALAHDPWENLGLFKQVQLTPEWQDFREEFVASTGDDNARIHFDLAASDIPVEIGDTALISLPDGQVVQPTRTARALILMYHRVADSSSDPWDLCVTPRHFDEHLAVLRNRAHPISLSGLLESLDGNSVVDRTVVVTFDDGYADNLHEAKPLLEKHGFPATFFLASGCIGREREFWWDELERLLLHREALPETLCLRVGGEQRVWKLGASSRWSDDDLVRHRDWRADQPPSTQRHALFLELHQLLQVMSADDRWFALEAIRVWAGAGPEPRPTHRPLSLGETIELAAGPLVEIGAHTVTHPVLSTLSIAAQRDELGRSKSDLEGLLNAPLTSFAYPYGGGHVYTAETVDAVGECGFRAACTTDAGMVRTDDDRLRLPRVMITDCDGDTFAERLEAWFSAEE